MTDAPTPLDLDAIEAAIAACRTYNFGMYQADRLAHEHAPALVAEVKRLRTVYAEVDREALRRFVDSFCDDEAGEVEHVVSVDRTSGFALTGGNDAHAVLCKAASALWPGESRATVQAEALREARDAVRASSFWADGSDNYADRVRGYLSARADRLAAEGGAS